MNDNFPAVYPATENYNDSAPECQKSLALKNVLSA